MTLSHGSHPASAIPGDSAVSRRTAMRLSIAGLLAAATGGATAPGCSGGQHRRAPGSFAYLSRGDIITLDLNQMSYQQDFRITYAMRQGLYAYDQVTGDARPALAASIEQSADKKTWRFTLRPDGRWSNGDAVTAHDFAFSWRLMLTSPSQYGYLLHYVRNARAYEQSHLDKKPLGDDTLGFRAIDDRTLEMELDNPLPFLPDLLAFPPFYPRHEPSMRPHRQADGSYDAKYTRPGLVVLNGAYVFESWEPGKRLLLSRNLRYWDAANVRSDTIELLINPDSQSALVQYKRGMIDWISDVPPEPAIKMKRVNHPDLHIAPAYSTAFLTINVQETNPVLPGLKSPLADQRVRRALSMAIDRQYIVDKITGMGERPAASYVPPGYFDRYTSESAPLLDIAGARRELAEAGYPNGTGFPQLAITYNSESSVRKGMAEYLAQVWSTTLGLPIALGPLDLKSYRNAISTKNYGIGLVSWTGDYLDLTTWTDKYLSKSNQNDSGWGPPEFDELCAAATVEPDAAKRQELLRRAEALINTQLPIIPLYHAVNVSLYPPNVHGLYANKKNEYRLDKVWVDRSAAPTSRPGTMNI